MNIECATCTLCSSEPSEGFFTGCMIRDIPAESRVNFNGWKCDGKGNLTRPTPMTLENLIAQLEVLSKEWRDKLCPETSHEAHWTGVGFDQAADDLDDLIAKARENTDTTP